MTTSRTQNEAEITRAAALEYSLRNSEGVNIIGRILSSPEQVMKQREAEVIAQNGFLNLASPSLLPNNFSERFLHIMKVSAMGYCADMKRDVRDWYDDIYWAVFEDLEDDILVMSDYGEDVDWRDHIIYRMYYIWLKVFKGEIGNIDEAREVAESTLGNPVLVRLLHETNEHEDDVDKFGNRVITYSRWILSTNEFLKYIDEESTEEAWRDSDESIMIAIQNAESDTESRELSDTLRWLAAASRVMMLEAGVPV